MSELARKDRWFIILRTASLVPVAVFVTYDLFVDAFIEGESATAHFIIESVVFVFGIS